MPKPRKAQVSLEATPYYHCVSRCVRRVFLCGEDAHSGQSYEHRREWIQKRMLSLGKVFANKPDTHLKLASQAVSCQSLSQRLDIKERYHAKAKKNPGFTGSDSLLPLRFPLRPPRLSLR